MFSKKSADLTLFAGFLLLFPSCFLKAQTIGLGKGSSHSLKSINWSYYKTDNKKESIEAVIKEYSAGRFEPLNSEILNAGISKKYYWIHFSVANSDEENSLVIDIENPRLNELELFEVAGDTTRSLGKTGDFYPFSQRPVIHKNFVYPVVIATGQSKEYFLFVNQVGHTFILPAIAYTTKSFTWITFRNYLKDGVTYGILLFVAVFSLLFFMNSKHWLYLYYGLYILTAILWFLSYFGLGYQYLWGNYPALNTSFAPMWATLNILLNVQICQVLLQSGKAIKWFNRAANVAKYSLAPVAFFPFINLNQYGYSINHGYLLVFLFVILCAMLIVLCSVSYYSVKGFLTAKLYLIASIVKAAGIVNLILLELGIVPAVYNMETFLQFGIFTEIALFSYALARRYAIFKFRTYEFVIEAHEEERDTISKEIHDSISGTLTGINLAFGNLMRNVNNLPEEKKTQMDKISGELKSLQVETRNISHNVMPDNIKNNPIVDIVERYIKSIQSNKKNYADDGSFIDINFSANEPKGSFSEAVKLNIFRIVQELITNILKHSKATNAELIFSFDKKELVIISDDNGVGMPRNIDKKEDGIGMKSIKSRVEVLGGSITIKSPAHKKSRGHDDGSPHRVTKDHGTMIRIKIPYRDNLLKNKNGYDYW